MVKNDLVIRNVNPEKDILTIVNLVTNYFSNYSSYFPKSKLDIKILLNSPNFCKSASYIVYKKDKAIGFIGALVRDAVDYKEGEILGPFVSLKFSANQRIEVMDFLLNRCLESLNKIGVKRILTVASPQIHNHYKFLEEKGFRPIKAMYLMKVSRSTVRYPSDIVYDLKIIPYSKLGKDNMTKLDFILSILNAAFFDDMGRGWDESELITKIREPVFDPNGVMIAYREGIPIGVIWVFVDEYLESIRGKKIGWVALIGLKKEFRGRKYGRTLLKAGLDYLFNEKGVDEVLLWVDSENSAAVKLYKLFNFKIERTSYIMWYLPTK